jgi:hypothetical protein
MTRTSSNSFQRFILPGFAFEAVVIGMVLAALSRDGESTRAGL